MNGVAVPVKKSKVKTDNVDKNLERSARFRFFGLSERGGYKGTRVDDDRDVCPDCCKPARYCLCE